jgi:hypothetical protein
MSILGAATSAQLRIWPIEDSSSKTRQPKIPPRGCYVPEQKIDDKYEFDVGWCCDIPQVT